MFRKYLLPVIAFASVVLAIMVAMRSNKTTPAAPPGLDGAATSV